MPYKEYTVEMLSEFSGRPVRSYPVSYSAQSLQQALLLFKIGTCLAAPDALDQMHLDMVDMAILSMADAIVLEQEFQKAKVSPFNSEHIGSYSYSKVARSMRATPKATLDTGIMWFDLAVHKLSVCDILVDLPWSGGIEVFENDAPLMAGRHGNLRFLGPQDIHLSRTYGWDPAPGYHYQQQPGNISQGQATYPAGGILLDPGLLP